MQMMTDIGLQVPKRLFFEFAGGEGRVETSQEEEEASDAWGVNLDIKELNVVLTL
jgi:hypothetical protein